MYYCRGILFVYVGFRFYLNIVNDLFIYLMGVYFICDENVYFIECI